MKTLKQAAKQGYVPTKIEIDVLMHPETGNLLFPCDGCMNKAFDKYGIISDPAIDEKKAVNLLCAKHKKRYHRASIPATLEGLAQSRITMFLEDKWEKLTERGMKRLHKKHGWFRWLFPEE